MALGTGQPDHHSVMKILHSQGLTPLRIQTPLPLTHCLLPALSEDVKEHRSAWAPLLLPFMNNSFRRRISLILLLLNFDRALGEALSKALSSQGCCIYQIPTCLLAVPPETPQQFPGSSCLLERCLNSCCIIFTWL